MADPGILVMIMFDVERVPPSYNHYLGQGSKRLQIKDYQDEKGIWVQELQILRNTLAKQMRIRGEKLQIPLQVATVITVYHFKGNGRRDPDNYAGKMIHDALVTTGILVDDSFNQVDPFPLARFGSKMEHTEIYITPGLLIRQIAENIVKGEI